MCNLIVGSFNFHCLKKACRIAAWISPKAKMLRKANHFSSFCHMINEAKVLYSGYHEWFKCAQKDFKECWRIDGIFCKIGHYAFWMLCEYHVIYCIYNYCSVSLHEPFVYKRRWMIALCVRSFWCYSNTPVQRAVVMYRSEIKTGRGGRWWCKLKFCCWL